MERMSIVGELAVVIGQGLVFGLVHSYQGWKSGNRDRGAGDLIWDAGRPPGQPSRQHHVPCLV